MADAGTGGIAIRIYGIRLRYAATPANASNWGPFLRKCDAPGGTRGRSYVKGNRDK